MRKIILGILIGIIAFTTLIGFILLIYSNYNNKIEEKVNLIKIPVAKEYINKGTTINDSMIEYKEISKNKITENMITTINQIIGKIANADIEKGAFFSDDVLITENKISCANILENNFELKNMPTISKILKINNNTKISNLDNEIKDWYKKYYYSKCELENDEYILEDYSNYSFYENSKSYSIFIGNENSYQYEIKTLNFKKDNYEKLTDENLLLLYNNSYDNIIKKLNNTFTDKSSTDYRNYLGTASNIDLNEYLINNNYKISYYVQNNELNIIFIPGTQLAGWGSPVAFVKY